MRRSIILAALMLVATPLSAQTLVPTDDAAEEEERDDTTERFVPVALPGDAADVVTGLNHFGLELYRAVSAERRGSVFLSPASVSSAFGLAYAGARGTTADEMAGVLRYPHGQARFHLAMGALLGSMQLSANGRELVVSNALWVQKEMRLHQDYLDLVARDYGAGLRRVDYRADSESARLAINGWVEERTRNRIRNLLTPLDVTPGTVSVLVNTIYFKADWAHPFEAVATRAEPFTTASGGKRTAQLMHRQLDLSYLRGEGFQAVALPYRGGETEMLVFLPSKPSGLPAFEKALTPEALARWTRALYETPGKREVILSLPKFKLEQRFELKGALEALGLKAVFSNASDFSGMKPVDPASADALDQNIKIDKVIQQVFLEVEEKGTEAVAATALTAIIVTGARRREPPVVFRADHPFFFALRDRRSGAVFFVGRYTGPD